MKKRIILVTISLFACITSSIAQWYPQYNGTHYALSSVYFIDQNTGWCVGVDRILKTTNGGINWLNLFSEEIGLRSVYFTDHNTGWAAGVIGVIYKTTNVGTTWVSQVCGNVTTYSVCFINNNTGWASGSNERIFKTTNGGTNWLLQFSDTINSLYSIDFVDQNTGWIVGMSGTIFKTTNAGMNWFNQTSGTNSDLLSVCFIDQNTGWCTGWGTIIKTTNSGLNWFTQLNGYFSSLTSIRFINQNTGWTAGGLYYSDSALIMKTTNGGANWFRQNGGKYGLYCIYFTDENSDWAVGDSGTILKTTNSGGPIGIKPISNIVPKEFKLYQNYPNPFNPTTTIEFEIPTPLNPPPAHGGINSGGTQIVRLIIYDILGREIATLVNEELKAGVYKVDFDGSNYSSGVYFYRLSTADFTGTKKMILLR